MTAEMLIDGGSAFIGKGGRQRPPHHGKLLSTAEKRKYLGYNGFWGQEWSAGSAPIFFIDGKFISPSSFMPLEAGLS